MKVRATKIGFYIGRRRAGDVFDVPEGAKASWFEPVAGPKPPAKPVDAKVQAKGKQSADDLA